MIDSKIVLKGNSAVFTHIQNSIFTINRMIALHAFTLTIMVIVYICRERTKKKAVVHLGSFDLCN